MDIMLEDDGINFTDEQKKLVPNKEFLASLFAQVKSIVRTRDRHRAGLPCCPAALPCPALPCRANLFFLPCPACPAGRPGQGTGQGRAGQGRAKKFALLTFLQT